jgi:hypothetical protein
MDMNGTDQTLELFTVDEIARLRIYKDAIAADFYTDDLPSSEDGDSPKPDGKGG